jgi:hypothetical protein
MFKTFNDVIIITPYIVELTSCKYSAALCLSDIHRCAKILINSIMLNNQLNDHSRKEKKSVAVSY